MVIIEIDEIESDGPLASFSYKIIADTKLIAASQITDHPKGKPFSLLLRRIADEYAELTMDGRVVERS